MGPNATLYDKQGVELNLLICVFSNEGVEHDYLIIYKNTLHMKNM